MKQRMSMCLHFCSKKVGPMPQIKHAAALELSLWQSRMNMRVWHSFSRLSEQLCNGRYKTSGECLHSECAIDYLPFVSVRV